VIEAGENASKLTFGLFELDLESGELYKAGFRVKIQGQPLKVLMALLEQPGHVMTREELQLRIWGRETTVDFDRSLVAAINKVREALGDSAENPRFVETLSRRGYRFIAPVQKTLLPASAISLISSVAVQAPAPLAEPDNARPAPPTLSSSAVSPSPGKTSTTAKSLGNRRSLQWLLALILIMLTVDTLIRYLAGRNGMEHQPPHIAQITRSGDLIPSFQYQESLAAADTDGVRLFASTLRYGRSQLVAISLPGGAATDVSLPDEVVNPVLGEISPDGSRFVLRSQLSREAEQPLWVVPTMGGSALRVGGVLAHDAAWMPDGKTILYATGNELSVIGLTDSEPQLYARLPGRAYWMRWSPDGALLRFTVIDPTAHTLSLWQISPSDRRPRPVLPDWSKPGTECCGTWTADGKSFVFQSAQGGETNLWRLIAKSLDSPQRLTDGPLQFQAPVAARSGSRIYFMGSDAQFTMQRYSAARHEEISEQSWLKQAIRVAYSRDGLWVAWTTPDGSLWRARSNGTEQLQLTPQGMEAFLADWSPDDTRLAVMARNPGQAWRIYLVSASGGRPRAALDDSRNAGDPSWSPDGQSLVFGRLNDAMGKDANARMIQILDLRSGHVETVPGSEGLYSPRWSPDGRYLAALSIDGRQVKLFTFASKQWTRLPLTSGADPHWSFDSHSLWVQEFANLLQPIARVSVPDMQIRETLNLVRPEDHSNLEFTFAGIEPSGDLLIRARTNMANFYTMNVDH
jgi:Tol biopolymer transport system component/DNA-binding winged helix-turn-helix (wHTH) protein